MSGGSALTEERDGLSSALEVPAGADQQLVSLDQRVRVLEEEVAWLREASATTDASGAMASASTPPSGVPRVYRDQALEPSNEAPEASVRQEPAAAAPSSQLTVELADLRAEVERLVRENRAQGAELALMRVLAAPQAELMQGLENLQESDLQRWPREAREVLREASDLVARLRLRIAELQAD